MKSFRITIALALMASMLLLDSCADKKIGESKDNSSVKREDIEWLRIWAPHTNDSELPRVLLIGDSITELFGPVVDGKLDGKAYVVRLTTSKSLGDPALMDEVAMVLSQYDFDVIHISNGLHGWKYTDEEFSAAIPQLYDLVTSEEAEAELIWATCTPARTEEENATVKSRNSIISSFAGEKGILIDDLFPLLYDHEEYYAGTDGIHPNQDGVAVIADKALEAITSKLN